MMTRTKRDLMSRKARKLARKLLIIASNKGGQGKSLLGQLAADHAFLHAAPLGVAQIDNQNRLARSLGRKVLTIDSLPGSARRDPGAEARAFTPLYAMIEKAAQKEANVLIDVGANQAGRFIAWAGLVDLPEDLMTWGFETIVMTPYVAEAEGIRQGGRTAEAMLECLPDARLVLIENERDGLVADLHPASDGAAAYREAIEPLKGRATVLRMPAVEGNSWRLFEAAHCRPVQVAGMPVEKVMALTGLPRPEAKIARGDVAAFAGIVFAELDRILLWSNGEDNNV